jgi:hypothetical protein
MKNILSVVVFAMVVLFSANNVAAQTLSQDQDRPEVIAKTKVAELSNQLSLNGDQQMTLFRAYTVYESNYKKHIHGKDAKDAAVMANKQKFDTSLQETVKGILTPEQYKKWLSMQEQ